MLWRLRSQRVIIIIATGHHYEPRRSQHELPNLCSISCRDYCGLQQYCLRVHWLMPSEIKIKNKGYDLVTRNWFVYVHVSKKRVYWPCAAVSSELHVGPFCLNTLLSATAVNSLRPPRLRLASVAFAISSLQHKHNIHTLIIRHNVTGWLLSMHHHIKQLTTVVTMPHIVSSHCHFLSAIITVVSASSVCHLQ